MATTHLSRKRFVRVAGLVAVAVGIPGLAFAASMSSGAAHAALSKIVHNASFVPSTSYSPASELTRACPKNMAHVGKSCVDKYEGSLVEVHEDGTEVPWSAHEAPNGHHVRAVSRPNVAPQGHISMVEAQKACKASHKRLCHGGEWAKACKGPERTTYPYGNDRVANACVDTNRTSPMLKLYGGERSPRTMNDPRANQMANTVENTGAAEACTNGYGVHDMVGNIHEWTDDSSFRGGYYLDTTQNGEGCNYRTTAHAPAYYDYSTGFRCCADENSLSTDAD